jgi:hypothetical protein
LSDLRKDSLTAEEDLCEHLCSRAFFISKERRRLDNNIKRRDLNGFEFL